MTSTELEHGIVSVSGTANELGLTTYRNLRDDFLGLRSLTPYASHVALQTDNPMAVLAVLASLDGWASTVSLYPSGVTPDLESCVPISLPSAPRGLGFFVGSKEGTFVTTRWTLFSSGTTAEPKAISHSLLSLARTVRTEGAPLVWGLTYDPNRMAGIQVLLQGFLADHSIVAPPADWPLSNRVLALRSWGVTALSATPTNWRRLLQLREVEGWPLLQVTLGGEIADQLILNALSAAFPLARITHVFASTEAAVAFSVSDGQAGFPVAYLEGSPMNIRLKVDQGVLYVHNHESECADKEGFVSTGDVVEVIGDRVFFKGRQNGAVNIGGANVWPEEVETLLRSHPAIKDAIVSSVPNPLSGNLLVATIVPIRMSDEEVLTKGLRRWVRERAPGVMVPAKFVVVADLPTSATGKAQR